MNADDISAVTLRALAEVAPEAALDDLDPDHSFHDQLDIDSMDFENFVAALSRELGIEIPGEDYYHLASLNGCRRYLQTRLK